MNSRLDELFASLHLSSPTPKGPITYLIVGLGNPGAKYDKNRHNVGFHAIDVLAEKHRISIKNAKFHALVGEGEIAGQHVMLMKPQTFMNLSGEAVREAANYYHIAPDHIIVYCDDVSFDVGHMRIRRKGSAGGHNGLKSIIAELGSDQFPRVKIGVGQKPHPDYDLADWVLGDLPAEAQKVMPDLYAKVAEATEMILEGHIEQAMNQYST
ncbi:MAG: aminoacyl-tRNA hydrolase [Clostridia bacterium]|nr:aminoacyl-tRNA hydrolase [Clostridia bacterium]